MQTKMQMQMKILNVTISAVISEGRILLIRRTGEPYTGYWALPGGKLEPGEQIEECAVREIREEAGIRTEFVKLLAVISEFVYSGGRKRDHFLLFLCRLRPLSGNLMETREGRLRWFSFLEIKKYAGEIVPSDVLMIKKFVLGSSRPGIRIHRIKMVETLEGRNKKYRIESPGAKI